MGAKLIFNVTEAVRRRILTRTVPYPLGDKIDGQPIGHWAGTVEDKLFLQFRDCVDDLKYTFQIAFAWGCSSL